jgi:hypothetical protein
MKNWEAFMGELISAGRQWLGNRGWGPVDRTPETGMFHLCPEVQQVGDHFATRTARCIMNTV